MAVILTNYSTRQLDGIYCSTVMSKPPTIGLLIETASAYGRGLLRGVQSYVRKHALWDVVVPEHSGSDLSWRTLPSWGAQGFIARIESPSVARVVQEWDVPVVNVSAHRLIPDIPSVDTDDQLVASMAFQHVYEQGFRHVAYCGIRGTVWSSRRRDYFVAHAIHNGMECRVLDLRRHQFWRDRRESLIAWLRELPRPLAVMASHDHLGMELVRACRVSGILVPTEVAIIGVGNDELVCESVDPSLSSVAPDAERSGYEAARFLSRLMANGPRVPCETLIRPTGVVARQSTDAYAIHDPEVAAAVQYISNYATKGIKVKNVLEAVPTSRRVLEKKFRKYLRRTPHEEILRVQLSRVSVLLLRETNLSLEKIAFQCGFRHVEYMTVVFKRELGQTPSEYRRTHGTSPSTSFT